MPPDRLAPADARAIAAALVRELAASAPSTLDLDGVDLGPALEQQLFFALRDGLDASVRRVSHVDVAAFARITAALGYSLLPRRQRPRSRESSPIVALIRQPARMAILEPIERALRRLDGPPLEVVAVAQATERAADGWPSKSDLAGTAPMPTHRLQDVLLPGEVVRMWRYQLRLPRGLRAADRAWSAAVGSSRAAGLLTIAARELPRIALGAAGLRSVVGRWRPSLLIGFDEVGTWSRILPAVAHASAVSSLNLPHAEAAMPVAIAGADYDRFAVFGPRAAAVLRKAGIPPERVVEIGAPHFDALVARPRPPATAPARPRRILYAAQYVQGAMTLAGLEACHRAVLAAATAAAPSELIVLPHPVQPAGLIEGIAGRQPVPTGVDLRIEHGLGLHDLLDDAWLLVTAWSNSVFEAALRGVPSLMIDVEHASPVAYAEEGLGIGVDTETGAAAAARALLDPAYRAATVERATAALAEHLGPLDGRAAERAADLIVSMARRKVHDPE